MPQVVEEIKRTPKTLLAARSTLERLHAYIELRGFDIGDTWKGSYDVDFEDIQERAKAGDFDEIPGAVCFIGGARLVAGVNPDDWDAWTTGLGDGPELPLALRLLDEAAEAAEPEWIKEIKEDLDETCEDGWASGKYAEAYGFQMRNRWRPAKIPQESWALPIVRGALTIAAKELDEV